MPLPQKLTDALRRALFGWPWGQVWPPRPPPKQATGGSLDVRTIALRTLRQYIEGIVFYLPGAVGTGQVIPFQVTEENFLLEQADYVHDMKFPSIVVAGSEAPGEYLANGFTSYLAEETRDQFGQGTVVQVQDEYKENLRVELWGSKEPEMRSMLAGMEVAFHPVENMAGLRLYMPDYYYSPVSFLLLRRQSFGEADGARGRRRAVFDFEMRTNVLSLVRYRPLVAQVGVQVDYDSVTGQPVNVVPQDPAIPCTDPNAPVPPPRNARYVVDQSTPDWLVGKRYPRDT